MNRFNLLLVLSVCLIFTQILAAQTSNVQKLIDHRNEEDFEQIQFMEASSDGHKDIDGSVLKKANYFFLDQERINEILETRPEALKFDLPTANGIRTLKLVEWNIFSENFEVRASSSKDEPFDYKPGIFYGGVIEGYENSMVSFSFFENEVIGMMSSHEEGKYNFGKITGSDLCLHVGYFVEDAMFDIDFSCEIADQSTEKKYTRKIEDQLNQKNPNNNPTCCVQVYWELDNDLVIEKGGVVGATNFFNGLFAQIAILYDNDDICVEIHSILAWDTPDPYPTGSAPAALLEFEKVTLPAGAHTGHLVSRGNPTNGGVAYLDQLCKPFPYAYSWIQTNYQNVPTYSWSVEVVTHELGHNLGSPHTHDCLWNGNNTAIDGCGPASGNPSTGNCAQGPIPGAGGTIMSYCHLGANPGINFNNGFGPQPQALIESRINACLGQCCTINATGTVNNGTTCSNTQDGSATVTVTGGPYTYLWDNGVTTQTNSTLSAGSHTVTITGASCSETVTVLITSPSAVTGSITNIVNLTCNGATDGSATVNGGGGTPPYTFIWDNGVTTQINSTLTGGNHSVTITDSNGCLTLSTLNITEPSAITFSTTVLSNASCGGASDGSATVSQGGGTPPYTYQWDDGSTAGTNNNLPAGTHGVTLTDNSGCTAVSSVIITAPPGMTVTTSVVSQASCNGVADGSATVTVNGGANPITYAWDNNESTATATALGAGAHTVTVSDGNGCVQVGSVTITQPNAITLTTTAISGVSCPNDTNGSASVTANGGSAPLSILWDNNETTATATSLTGGPHTVTVTDANSCTATASVTVTSPPLVIVTETHTDISCNGLTDGTITVTVTGGTPPLTNLWSNGSTALNQSNLSANTYILTVTDNNGCTDITTVVINEPGAVSATTTVNNNVGCFGASDGSVTATPVGGTAPFAYVWSNGETNATATALAAGGATVTITDTNGCSAVGTASISQPASFTASVTLVNNASCNGDTDGSATASQQGGTSPYTYLWDSGQSVATANNLDAGTHLVTVTDSNGCEATASIAITEPVALTVTITIDNNVSCNSSSDGAATAVPSGGTSPYNFLWDSGQTSPSTTILTAGAHTVTITDSNGCTVIGNTTITQPPALSATATLDNDVSCSGGADGGATAAGAGGNPPFTYLWDSGQTDAIVTNLDAGTHTVTVTDVTNCSATASVIISQPGNLSATIVVNNNVSCFGGDDGNATATVTGGSGPFSYLWQSNETTVTATGLSAGTQNLTITDVNGCAIVINTMITEPASMSISTTVISNVTCNGLSNGSASATAGGGTAPFSFAWDSGHNGQTATNLDAGTHVVTLTDANGCAETASVSISEPSALTVSLSLDNNVACNGESNGGATVMATGGTSPYTYQWNNGGTSPINTNLNAGTQSVSVTDDNGCVTVGTIVITEPTSLTVSISADNNVFCNGGNDGAATAVGAGGTLAYTYSWNNGAITPSVTNLPVGTHMVTITDANNCTAIGSVVITEPIILTGVITVNNNVSCNGGSDGNATITATGGTTPYSYTWDSGQTGAIATALTAGNHTATITDANNCSLIVSTSITEPAVTTISTSLVNDVSCNGFSDGSATATSGGGVGPYNYTWDSGHNGPTATNLNAGTHTVTLTDANGCTATGSILINEPTALSASASLDNNVACNGESNGGATVNVNGGTTPYSYQWDSGQTGASASNLDAGTHMVTVTDNNSCTVVASVVVTEPITLTSNAGLISNASCNGDSDGSAIAQGAGGTIPYAYLWDSGQSGPTANTLNAGTHSVTITDANGCTTTNSVIIGEPTLLMATTVNNSNVTCNGLNDGNATVTATGGSIPYNYLWDSGQTVPTTNNLDAGTHTVTVTDANSCTVVASVVITEPTVLSSTVTVNSNISCNGQNDGNATINATGGTVPYAYSWDTGQTTQTASNLTPGGHIAFVTDANGCISSTALFISEPSGLNVSIGVDNNVSCNGLSDGGATVSPQGGTTPYSYNWDSGETSPIAILLDAGTHTVSVTDANGCSVTASVIITEPVALTATSVFVSDVSCNGGNDGNGAANGVDGTPPYTYLWPSGETTAIAIALTAGNQTATITDSNGCETTTTVAINEPPVLSSSVSLVSNTSCNGMADGSATATQTGGSPGFSYAWDNGETTPTALNLAAGTHNVTITDFNGCTSVSSITITEPLIVTASTLLGNNVGCNGQANGSAIASGLGGTSPYSYLWDNGETTQTAVALTAGVHSVIITDANGCSATSSVTISEPSVINITTTVVNNISCFGLADGSATATPTGGVGPYTYQWDNGEFTPTAINLGQGINVISITDSNGCLMTGVAIIAEPPVLTTTTSLINNITCNGSVDGSAEVLAQGGVAPYSYMWSNGQVSNQLFNAAAGTYTVSVTDTNGCLSISSIGISEPQPVSVSIITGDASCNGNNDGTATGQGAGGTPPYTYQWSNGETQQTAISYAPGQHTVIVTDANGCTAMNSFVIGSPSALTLANLNLVPVACNGGNDGSATIDVTGGTAPYAYQWSTGANTNTESGLAAGNYQVTITDISGCELIANVAITEPATVMSLQILGTDVDCFGETTGSVTVVPTGGNPAYTYSWNNGAVQQTAFDLSAGSYSVTVTDQNGCKAAASVLLDQPDQLLAQIDITDAICPGEDNGSIGVVSVAGGVSPYVYSIDGNNYQPDTSFQTLTAGNYDIYVQDLNGCVLETNNVTVDENDPIEIDIYDSPSIEIVLGDSIQLSNTVTPIDTNHTYTWEPAPTLNCNDCPEPVAQPVDDTEYLLTVIDTLNGCDGTASITVLVNKERNFFVPNAFSPNGDGINDILLPFGGPDVAVVRSFNIFDRWGEEVHRANNFSPNDPEFGWDGRFKGKKTQSGVYIFFAVVEFIDGTVIEYTNDITLIK